MKYTTTYTAPSAPPYATLRITLITLGAAIALGATLTLQGCADQRSVDFAQGAGINADPISQYTDGSGGAKRFTLQTQGTVGAQPNASGSIDNAPASVLTVSDQVTEMNALGLVDYTVSPDETLLGHVPLIARPHTNYELRYVLTDKYLKIVLVAPLADIPYTQVDYAEKLRERNAQGVELYQVPLKGYGVKYLRVERRRNPDREETNDLIEIPVTTRAQATHVRVSMTDFEIYEAVSKTDVFPATLFDGDWYYAETIIDTGPQSDTEIGSNFGGVDADLKLATKISILRTENTLIAANSAIDRRLDPTKDENLRRVFSIPVKHLKYRAQPSGSDQSLKEEDISNQVDWRKRNRIKVDFSKLSPNVFEITASGQIHSLPGTTSEEDQVKDIQIDRDSILITVFRRAQNSRVRYSLLRAKPRAYSPRRLHEQDRERFGFFTTLRPELDTFAKYRREDIERNLMLSRFNPESPQIVFHFSDASTHDASLRASAREAVRTWNDAFKQAGSKTKIVLDESRPTGLGDLRYNAINLIDSVSQSFVAGLGPSINDPYTGEIISSTANVYIAPIRSNLVWSIRKVIADQVGVRDGKAVIAPGLEESDPFDNEVQNLTNTLGAGALTVARPVQTRAGFDVRPAAWTIPERGQDGKLALTELLEKPSARTQRLQDIRNKRLGSCEDSTISEKNISENVAKLCPDIGALITKLKPLRQTVGTTQSDRDEELQTVVACANRLLPGKVLSTLVHEMGHGFGLRHNFLGSVDKDNFLTKDQTQTETQVRSSSIMEYTAWDEDRLTQPGPYDIAAIRYGYTGQVETIDGGIATLDTERSIDAQIDPTNLKPYLFCTDEDLIGTKSALCSQFDAGTTPDEVVAHAIKVFHDDFRTYYFRYDRFRAPSEDQLMARAFAQTLWPVKRIYDEWRAYLNQYLPPNKGYLETYDSESYQALINALSKDPRFAPIVTSYYPAAQRSFKFLMQLVNMPNRYCVIKTKGTELEASGSLIELEKVRAEVYRQTGTSVASCADEMSVTYLTSLGFELVDEIGHANHDLRYSMALKDTTQPVDVVGSEMLRMLAAEMLALRVYTPRNANAGIVPNFYDEPLFRDVIFQNHFSRLFYGVSLDGEKYELKNVRRFVSESSLLNFQNAFLKAGLIIPGKVDVTTKRLASLSADLVRNAQEAKTLGATIGVDVGNGYLTLLRPAPLAQQAIQKIKAIDAESASPAALQQALNTFAQAVVTKLQALMSAGQEATLMDIVEFSAMVDQALEAAPLIAQSPALAAYAAELKTQTDTIQAAAKAQSIDLEDEAAIGKFLAQPANVLQLTQTLDIQRINLIFGELKEIYAGEIRRYQSAAKDAPELAAQRGLLIDLITTDPGMYLTNRLIKQRQ